MQFLLHQLEIRLKEKIEKISRIPRFSNPNHPGITRAFNFRPPPPKKKGDFFFFFLGGGGRGPKDYVFFWNKIIYFYPFKIKTIYTIWIPSKIFGTISAVFWPISTTSLHLKFLTHFFGMFMLKKSGDICFQKIILFKNFTEMTKNIFLSFFRS